MEQTTEEKDDSKLTIKEYKEKYGSKLANAQISKMIFSADEVTNQENYTNEDINKTLEIEEIIPQQKRAVLPKLKLPIEDLPSKGVCYPKNAIIYYSPYLTTEIEKVSIALESGMVVINDLFEMMIEGISCKNMDKLDLTFHDFLFICIYKKVASFGEDSVSYSPECPKCLSINQFVYTYNKIGFYDLEATREELPIKKEFKFYYPNPEDPEETIEEVETLEFMPITIGRMLSIYKNNRNRDKNAFLVYQCSNKDPEDLLDNKFIEMTINYTRELKKIENKFNHGMKPKVESCTHKEKNQGELGGESICSYPIVFPVDTGYTVVLPVSFNEYIEPD